jgi:hypothetical protein
MNTPPNTGDVTLTREEQAFFIRSFWEASTAPDWKDDPLIELGKAVGAKIPLSRLTTHQLDALWPFLLQVAQKLGFLVLQQASQPKEGLRPETALSREDTAFFMRSYYEAISAPSWKRADLIAFGTTIRDKVPLAKLDESQMKVFMPYLLKISQRLGSLVIRQAEANRPAPAPPAPPAPVQVPAASVPGPTPSVAPDQSRSQPSTEPTSTPPETR